MDFEFQPTMTENSNTDVNMDTQGKEFQMNYAHNLLNDMKSIWKRKELCDITLIADGNHFQAHRIVLAGSSKYFHAMFTGGLAESHQDVIELHGITATGLEACLDCIYSGDLKLDLNTIQDVLGAANHLQVYTYIFICIDTHNVVIIKGSITFL